MSAQSITFRSRAEREKEVLLVQNYREIGIAAIAAASQAVRSKPKADNDAAALPALAAAE
ncbi:hypothetical protein [Antarcticirhabdus aurantiaca]|uniref:Uncharacterized protein n=1 Tax=Antarcticirhabdus aurantiaca TaxID=2606717 RepID=A0ACD4NIE2_9HYPH|nr:hypothetical protein [Antarcticirhabdus aurantiaca]WAJ26604.1 hypothetical protein OXU80_17195 [Jeongeuplla avenae]